MKLALAIRLMFLLLSFTITATLAVSLSKPSCQEKCGNVTIPYPFGIGEKCSANSSFTVICKKSAENLHPAPFLALIDLEILYISMYGIVTVQQPVLPMNCSDGPLTDALSISLKGTPFTIAVYNVLVVIGCKNLIMSTIGGCTAMCAANSTDFTCNGINCCHIVVPTRLQELQLTYRNTQANGSSFCGYAFLTDNNFLQMEYYRRYKGVESDMLSPFDKEFGFAPMVLEWEYGTETNVSNAVCSYYSKDPDDFSCLSLSNIHDPYKYGSYASSGGYCSCRCGYNGNPHTVEGCSDIDECSDAKLNDCSDRMTCINQMGSYTCQDFTGYYEDENDGLRVMIRKVSIVVGSVVGGLILLTIAWKTGKAIAERIKARRKSMFFKRNGGILLEQQLAAIENSIEKTKLFSSNDLAKATGDYNENRIIGRGGEGVVYKGMLEDGKIVAVKKSERVNQGDVEAFINEVVIVSQINHRNVVKLLGCCLECEVPLLVYEFIPNGTLFSHIHHPHEDFPLFWKMRLRIAKQIAGALAYLHSAASVPIYHRDIKSTNILLDEKYRAKISDFGTSRSILIDQTHVTTRVVGTFGYLDPEYFQSNQFTEKSDVYSFGVVLVELLTGEKAISAIRVEEGRGLAMHFLHSMEEDRLFNIVDAKVLRDGKSEEIEAMADIARKCLHLNGKSRPTMMEVAHHLEGIQVEEQESYFLQIQVDNIGTEDVESDDSSSISEIIESRES